MAKSSKNVNDEVNVDNASDADETVNMEQLKSLDSEDSEFDDVDYGDADMKPENDVNFDSKVDFTRQYGYKFTPLFSKNGKVELQEREPANVFGVEHSKMAPKGSFW